MARLELANLLHGKQALFQLSYTRVAGPGIEPGSLGYGPSGLPFPLPAAGMTRIELACSWLTTRRPQPADFIPKRKLDESNARSFGRPRVRAELGTFPGSFQQRRRATESNRHGIAGSRVQAELLIHQQRPPDGGDTESRTPITGLPVQCPPIGRYPQIGVGGSRTLTSALRTLYAPVIITTPRGERGESNPLCIYCRGSQPRVLPLDFTRHDPPPAIRTQHLSGISRVL